MRENFLKSLNAELKYEGGFSNHKRDPGGATLEGVIQRVYDGFNDRKGQPRRKLSADMRRDPEWIADRNEIYRQQYWNAIRGDELPSGVDIVVFDGAVNSGPYQSAKWLQRALGVEADGHIGEATLAALTLCSDHDALIADILSRRLGMLRALKTWSDFGDGWSARIANVKQIGQAWAIGSVGPMPVNAGSGKAYASDVVQPPLDAQVGTQASAGGAGVGVIVEGAKRTLEPFVGTSNFVTNIYLGLTCVAVLIAVGGAVYAFMASRKSKHAQRAIDGDVSAEIPEGQPA